jgi:hypothetical protein
MMVIAGSALLTLDRAVGRSLPCLPNSSLKTRPATCHAASPYGTCRVSQQRLLPQRRSERVTPTLAGGTCIVPRFPDFYRSASACRNGSLSATTRWCYSGRICLSLLCRRAIWRHLRRVAGGATPVEGGTVLRHRVTAYSQIQSPQLRREALFSCTRLPVRGEDRGQP